ncbi:MAG: FkbM family methyltransferase [Terriglobia bacterium]
MSDELDILLKELLSESPEETAQRMRDGYERAALSGAGKVVIFGVGQLGQFLLPAVRSAGLEPLAYCDNNSRHWGVEIDGVPVMSPADALRRYGDRASFLLALYNATPVHRQLSELGCRHIVRYPLLYWRYADFIPDERLALPQRILEQAAEMKPAYELLSDEESREEFRAQVRWRCLLDYDCLPQPHPPGDIYFPPDLVSLLPEEVFIDCGAFNGDTIRSYLAKAEGRFRHIYAFEPDAANLHALGSYLESLAPGTASRITVQPFAIGERDETVRFNAHGSVGSKVVESGGTVEVECRRLDSAIAEGMDPTYVKMDIEGAEAGAIAGATKTVARCHPVIAACAYHYPEHLWILPKLLKAASPSYRIYLRRYAEECWETVYYAVPPGRLRADATRMLS